MQRVHFDAGQRIFAQGDRSDGAFLVVVGRVEINADLNGKSIALQEIGPGGIFGEMGLIDQAPRSATAIAKVETTCAAYEPDEFSALVKSDPEELMRITRTLIHRLRETDQKYIELLTACGDGSAG